jgi:hypothetical protein
MLALTGVLMPTQGLAMPRSRPSVEAGLGRPVLEGGRGLRSEAVTYTCEATGAFKTPRCRLVVSWVLSPSTETSSLVFAMHFAEIEGIELDGVPVQPELDHAERYGGYGRELIRVHLPPSEGESVLELKGELQPELEILSRFPPLIHVRHAFVHRFTECTAVWYGERDSSIPAVSTISMRRTRPLRRRATIREAGTDTLPLCVGRDWNGGPFIGVGAGFEPKARLRLRAGYDLSSYEILAHGIAIESDLRQVLVVPYTDVGTPNVLLFIPSVAFGAGVPLRVWPDVRPGVRLQLTLSWPVLSIVGTFDAFPPIRGEPVAYYGAVLTQLGF